MQDAEELRRLATELATFRDRQAIAETLNIYCRAIDSADTDLLKSVFHPDGVNDLGDTQVNAHAWAEQVIPVLRGKFTHTLHSVSNLDIRLDGDRAVSESAFSAYHQMLVGRDDLVRFFGRDYAEAAVYDDRGLSRHEYIGTGRYLHRWERRQGEWRMTLRLPSNEFNRFAPASVGAPGSIIAGLAVMSRRDPNDPISLGLSG